MTDDLVEQLRDSARIADRAGRGSNLLIEAGDEIKHLRAENLRLGAALWAIAHAAGIETKADLMDAARAALGDQK